MSNSMCPDNVLNNDEDPLSQELDTVFSLLSFLKQYFHLPKNCYCNLVNVAPETIQMLNKQYRGKDNPTDVLSFMTTADQDLTQVKTLSEKTEEYCFGEIVISEKTIRHLHSQHALADTYGDDLNICVIHGYLHLLGYTHTESHNNEAMLQLQRTLYKKYKKNYE